jgi:peptidoglycan/xylan/chitin deacetylase (PgdA/CDA1 family)
LAGAETIEWPNGARVAVSLSYDDALNSQLDTAVPALDAHGFKASFYLVMSGPTIAERLHDWRGVAASGHELGNHSMFHACSGSLPDRDWVTPDRDLDTKNLQQLVDEIITANAFLHAIDGETERTFTPPCGDLYASGENYLPKVGQHFIAIKGQEKALPTDKNFLYGPFDVDGSELIDYLRAHTSDGALVGILFHGVGGDYLQVSAEAHAQLLQFLADNQDIYWVDTYRNIMQHVASQQPAGD